MKLMIIGAVGYGKVVADIAIRCGYTEVAFLDDNESIKECMGYPVVGKACDAIEYWDFDFFVAIGNSMTREWMINVLMKNELNVVTLIHPDASIATAVSIGVGSVIMAGAVINSDSKIGKGCIVNTGSSVDHDDIVDDYVHLAVGSHLAGTVHIGKNTWIGAGAIISNNIDVCANCMIGAGAVVIKDISIAGTYVGVPAKKIR